MTLIRSQQSVVSAMAAATRAVIVHYGEQALTRLALQSVLSGTALPGSIVLVDNGPDEFPDIDRASGPRITVVRPGHNTGFGGGVMAAMAAKTDSPTSYAWLLNNDAVAEPGALAELLAAEMRAGGLALVSSQVEDEKTKEVWSEAAQFLPWRMESRQPARRSRDVGDATIGSFPSWRSTPFLPGCSLLIPTVVLNAVGGLDRTFFMYGEDVDLSLRCARRGYPLVVARDSVVVHRTSSGTEARSRERMVSESGFRLTRTHYSWLLPVAILGALATGLKRSLNHRRSWPLTTRLQGYWDALRTRPGHSRGSPLNTPRDWG